MSCLSLSPQTNFAGARSPTFLAITSNITHETATAISTGQNRTRISTSKIAKTQLASIPKNRKNKPIKRITFIVISFRHKLLERRVLKQQWWRAASGYQSKSGVECALFDDGTLAKPSRVHAVLIAARPTLVVDILGD